MTMPYRVLISLGIIAIDFIFFFVPLTALFLAYIILYNPPWFRSFLSALDGNLENRRGDRNP